MRDLALLRTHAWLLVGSAIAIATSASCTGDIGGEEEQEVPGPPDVEPMAVPAAPELVASTSTCSPLRPGEKLVSVSPEGHVWLVVPGETSSVRVLDAFGGELVETIDDVAIGDVVEAQAWSARDAALVAGERLWRLQDLARIELTPPSGFTAPVALCGDPAENGALVSGGRVYERRASEWWGWDPGLGGDEAPREVVRFDGDCQGPSDVMWLTSADGTLFRVEPAQYSRPVRFEGLVDAAATDALLAVLDADELWVGPESWQSWRFSGPVPTRISASQGQLWMASGAQLLRFDGTTWVEIAHTMSEPITDVAAYAGGAWIAGATTVCHQATGPAVRVEGVRPFERSIELEYPLRVRASDDSADIVAEIGGLPITLVQDVESGYWEGTARLDTVGWHTITVTASGGLARRTIPVKRVPEVSRSWAVDIEPIYQASCSSSDCHGAGSTKAPEMGTYDAWQTHASAVRTRVVDAKNMPPAANVGPEWGSDDIEVIQEWLEGGMLP